MDISGFPMPDVNAIGTMWNFYFKDKALPTRSFQDL